MLRALFTQAFDQEDKPIIEAAYENAGDGDFWSQRPIFLGVDAGGARARRLLEDLIRKEEAARPSGSRAAEQVSETGAHADACVSVGVPGRLADHVDGVRPDTAPEVLHVDEIVPVGHVVDEGGDVELA